MNPLQRFEQRLETVISGVFARAFRSAVQPVEIAAAAPGGSGPGGGEPAAISNATCSSPGTSAARTA